MEANSLSSSYTAFQSVVNFASAFSAPLSRVKLVSSMKPMQLESLWRLVGRMARSVS